MLDFNAYLAAQHLTRQALDEALPTAPDRPDRFPLVRRSGVVTARQVLSLALHRLADAIETSSPAYVGAAMREASARGGCC